MSSNPQWKSFQSSANMNQDSTLLEYKAMPVTSNGKSAQAFGSYAAEYASLLDKSNNFGYGASARSSSNARFPIGTFSSLDSNHLFNNSDGGGGGGGGDSNDSLLNPIGGSTATTNGNNGSSSSYDSNAANLGTRETGIIEKLLHSYGFIQCCERQARLFFHFSQFSGNIEHLKIGDPVEFEMTYDRRTGKPIASTVTKIAPEVVLSEERVTGNVTTELRTDGSAGDTQGRISYENRGECFFLPYTKDDVEGNVTLRAGDKVSFQIATNQRGNLGACHIRLENPVHPVKYQGVVCSMKDSFGFIERADVVKEIFFHFSEVKNMKDELRLGDDVEFIIQTRNGKEVACNITRLPSGTVIFEDVGTEIVKGQVLKPLERGQGVARHQNDPLPGRIRYRAPDHSEVEVPFGDKDQRGDFTLRHGDWVQFRIATDRRDQLQRATNIALLDESFVVSGERREHGIVASVKDGFGFLRCVEREPRLFFHFNEVLDTEHEVSPGDEFEFTVIQDQQPGAAVSGGFGAIRQSAIRMKRLSPGTVRFETLYDSEIVGVVCKEAIPTHRSPVKQLNGKEISNADLNSDTAGLISYHDNNIKKTIPFYLKDQRTIPRMSDKVEFNIYQVKRTKEMVAMDVQILQAASRSSISANHNGNQPIQQGFIAALKDGFGFIETVEHDREVFFHFSNFEGDSNSLELGQEVEYCIGLRGSSGSCTSAENVRILPRGTIKLPAICGEILDGTIVRPLRSVNPDQQEYSGLIRVSPIDPLSNVEDQNNEEAKEVEFGIMGLTNKRELLQVGDPVQFQLDEAGRAANIVAVRKKRRATVDAYKGPFGFLTYEVDEGKKLFFHVSEVKDNVMLQVGDHVEFELVTNHRNGKSSACNVTKVSDVQTRPERLISRLRTISVDDSGPKLTVVRQPRGPDGTKGFSSEFRRPRLVGVVSE